MVNGLESELRRFCQISNHLAHSDFFSGQHKMKIGLLLWHSIQNPKKAQIIWSSERPPVCWYPRTIPLFLSVIRQDIEVSCWNWIGMMNGCFLAWIVIKSWVFCQAKWGLWFKWQMVFIFFLLMKVLTILIVSVVDAQCLKCRNIAALSSTGSSQTCLCLWWFSFYQMKQAKQVIVGISW